jgi:hypothetical protein
MALTIAAITTAFGPTIKSLAETSAKELAKKLFGKLKGRFAGETELETALITAIEGNRIEDFIKENEKNLPGDAVAKLRSLASMKSSFDKVDEILKAQVYTEEAANSFIQFAKSFEDVTSRLSFEEAGVKEIDVEDAETSEKIAVKSEEYTEALLLRYAAAVWTQLGARLTPELKGWSLEYDSKVKVIIQKPTILAAARKAEVAFDREVPASAPVIAPEAGGAAAKGLDLLRFRSAYTSLMQSYKDSLPVRDNYVKAASCLKSALIKSKAAKGRQHEIHKHMDPKHLEGLIQAFRGEAQYWLFNISEDLAENATMAREIYDEDRKQVEEYLKDTMGVTKAELNEFFDALNLYDDMGKGFSGALKLYKEAADKCSEGKDEDMIKTRISETEKYGSNKSSIFVQDPKPIL